MSNATWLRQYAASGGRKGCSHEMADELKEAAAEIERLRETVALMEKRIIQLQGHDAVYCQDLKSCAPSDKGNTNADN